MKICFDISIRDFAALTGIERNKIHRLLRAKSHEALAYAFETVMRQLRDKSETAPKISNLKISNLEQKNETVMRQLRDKKKRNEETENIPPTPPIKEQEENKINSLSLKNNIILEEKKSAHAHTYACTPVQGITKPTVTDIEIYCKEKGYSINAYEFYDFYEANGWVQGKGQKPIKNWKACVRTWKHTKDKDNAKAIVVTDAPMTDINSIREQQLLAERRLKEEKERLKRQDPEYQRQVQEAIEKFNKNRQMA